MCILYIMYIYTKHESVGCLLDIIISNSSEIPIYEQIVRQIKNLIMNGNLKDGDALPSIRTLAKELQISSITTKRAYEELERENYIVSNVGRGSFVNARNKDILREMRLKIVEEKLADAVKAAKTVDMSIEEIIELTKLIYDE